MSEGYRVAIDTNRISDLFRGDHALADALASAAAVFVPFVTLAEFEFAIAAGTKAKQNRDKLDAFMGRKKVRLVYPDDVTLKIYGRLSAQLRRIGIAIPHNDIWIAALCIQHDLILLTRDTHFKHVPEVRTL